VSEQIIEKEGIVVTTFVGPATLKDRRLVTIVRRSPGLDLPDEVTMTRKQWNMLCQAGWSSIEFGTYDGFEKPQR